MEIQSFHLTKRVASVMIGSFFYIMLINVLTVLLGKSMWKKIKHWIKNIVIEHMTYNALAPRESVARPTSS